MTSKVLYKELLPSEFRERLEDKPIAYLPLGTLEWHGEHMPLGSDGIQSQALFELIAREFGGIVLPMLFLGPDIHKAKDDGDFFGMDIYDFEGRDYDHQQLDGSAYWVSDIVFKAIIDSTARQLSRTGFKILVAHGHGPSTIQFQSMIDALNDKYGLDCYICFFDDLGKDRSKIGFQVDHGASNETSIVMAVRGDLVDHTKIEEDMSKLPKGVAGIDPRGVASPQNGDIAINYTKDRMIGILKKALNKFK